MEAGQDSMIMISGGNMILRGSTKAKGHLTPHCFRTSLNISSLLDLAGMPYTQRGILASEPSELGAHWLMCSSVPKHGEQRGGELMNSAWHLQPLRSITVIAFSNLLVLGRN